MNVPPQRFIRVPMEALGRCVTEILSGAGAPASDARLIASLLVDTDLRGVFSHGTICAAKYARWIREGSANPKPRVRLVDDRETTLIVDGDGGLGHLAAHFATELTVERARTHGLAAATARNHAHFGGAGKYTRMIARHDCFGFCVSGHTIHPPKLSEPNWNPMGNPPMSFAFPSGQEAPLILDMGSSWFEPEHFPGLYQRAPAAFFKSMGLVGVTNFLAGIMAGMMDPVLEREQRPYAHAGYGTFVLAVDIARFVPVADFVAESDRTMRVLHELPPLPGCARYDLPGGPEWEREKDYRTHGIPVGPEHQVELEGICAELEVAVPWAG
ncbi:MAG: Ldh family oxidoreductase [Gemmatimonadota bacterium]